MANNKNPFDWDSFEIDNGVVDDWNMPNQGGGNQGGNSGNQRTNGQQQNGVPRNQGNSRNQPVSHSGGQNGYHNNRSPQHQANRRTPINNQNQYGQFPHSNQPMGSNQVQYGKNNGGRGAPQHGNLGGQTYSVHQNPSSGIPSNSGKSKLVVIGIIVLMLLVSIILGVIGIRSIFGKKTPTYIEANTQTLFDNVILDEIDGYELSVKKGSKKSNIDETDWFIGTTMVLENSASYVIDGYNLPWGTTTIRAVNGNGKTGEDYESTSVNFTIIAKRDPESKGNIHKTKSLVNQIDSRFIDNISKSEYVEINNIDELKTPLKANASGFYRTTFRNSFIFIEADELTPYNYSVSDVSILKESYILRQALINYSEANTSAMRVTFNTSDISIPKTAYLLKYENGLILQVPNAVFSNGQVQFMAIGSGIYFISKIPADQINSGIRALNIFIADLENVKTDPMAIRVDPQLDFVQPDETTESTESTENTESTDDLSEDTTVANTEAEDIEIATQEVFEPTDEKPLDDSILGTKYKSFIEQYIALATEQAGNTKLTSNVYYYDSTGMEEIQDLSSHSLVEKPLKIKDFNSTGLVSYIEDCYLRSSSNMNSVASSTVIIIENNKNLASSILVQKLNKICSNLSDNQDVTIYIVNPNENNLQTFINNPNVRCFELSALDEMTSTVNEVTKVYGGIEGNDLLIDEISKKVITVADSGFNYMNNILGENLVYNTNSNITNAYGHCLLTSKMFTKSVTTESLNVSNSIEPLTIIDSANSVFSDAIGYEGNPGILLSNDNIDILNSGNLSKVSFSCSELASIYNDTVHNATKVETMTNIKDNTTNVIDKIEKSLSDGTPVIAMITSDFGASTILITKVYVDMYNGTDYFFEVYDPMTNSKELMEVSTYIGSMDASIGVGCNIEYSSNSLSFDNMYLYNLT